MNIHQYLVLCHAEAKIRLNCNYLQNIGNAVPVNSSGYFCDTIRLERVRVRDNIHK